MSAAIGDSHPAQPLLPLSTAGGGGGGCCVSLHNSTPGAPPHTSHLSFSSLTRTTLHRLRPPVTTLPQTPERPIYLRQRGLYILVSRFVGFFTAAVWCVCACSAGTVGSFSNKPLSPKHNKAREAVKCPHTHRVSSVLFFSISLTLFAFKRGVVNRTSHTHKRHVTTLTTTLTPHTVTLISHSQQRSHSQHSHLTRTRTHTHTYPTLRMHGKV